MRKTTRGFTLLELSAVMLIIGIFVTLAIPNYSKMIEDAKYARAKVDIHNITLGLNTYYIEKGQYPNNLNQLLSQGYMKHLPKDPWGRAYMYNKNIPSLSTYAADGQVGGTGNNTDIFSYELF